METDDIATTPALPQARVVVAGRYRRGAAAGLVVLRRLPTFWPFLLWTAVLALARVVYGWSSHISAAIWGLLILWSFIAWGSALVRTFRDDRDYGWGLNGSLGMALAVVVFGVLACFRLVSVRAIVAWTALGPLLFDLQRTWRGATIGGDLRAVARRFRAFRRRPQALVFLLGLTVLFILALFHYASAVGNTGFNPWDDEMAYRGFARQFLDRGTLYEPFSFRRVGAYGGQSLLQAMVIALADPDRIHIFDNGIAMLLLLGLITGYRAIPRWASRAAVLAAGFTLLTLPYTPHNLGSAFSGVVIFLALFRLFDHPRFGDAAALPNAILIGLVTAAGCTLRQNYFSAAIGFVAFWYLALVLFPGGRRRLDWFKQGALTAGAVIVFLLPWLVLAIIATGTPLYPMFKGNVRPDFGMVGKVSFDEEIRWALANVFVLKPLGTMAMLFAAGFLLPGSRRNRAVHVFLLASIFAFCLMIHFFQAFRDSDSIARYYFGFTLAFGFAIMLSSLTQAAARRAFGVMPAAALVMFAVGYQFMSSKDHVLKTVTAEFNSFNELIKQRGGPKPSETEALYKRIQDSVPPKERILVMLDHTQLLDGKRNESFNFDHPCATGFKPGPPCFQGPEAMVAYLKQHRIRYIAYQLGASSPEYNVAYWESKAAPTKPAALADFYERQARFELDFFGTLNALSASRRSLFHEGDIRVLDLETRSH